MRCRLVISIILVQLVFELIITAYTLRSNEPPRFLSKKSCRFTGGGCQCIVRLRGECCCKGHEIKVLPTNLTTTIRTLVMSNVSIGTIDSMSFHQYPNLEEIEIYDSSNLSHFDGNSLRHLTNLRKVSITYCRKLEEISEVLLASNLKIQSLLELSTEQKRLLMLYEYKFGSNTADAARRINKGWATVRLENQQSASD
ncbi:hypothetical protein KIN20_007000 [Parelaphostrongylus tenuis]|uniref:Uncharacterized protein n=1 Tax=Parelaphostrongylus tenuis TaxID=148309 RepID=A0AAD5M749_PARTN|nr:hypothetical protein KIN20_007000 [Parelaphostrongylus tenuis]